MILFVLLTQFTWAQQDPCLSSECETLSKRYWSHIKHDADPCEDFYEYACGNYPAQHPIPEGAEKMTMLGEMQIHINKQIKEFLENTKYGNISRSLHLAKTFFDSCKNEKSRELFGKEPLDRLITSLDGWSLIDNSTFNETTFQWEELLGNILHHGVYYVFEPLVFPSSNDNEKHILNFETLTMFLQKPEEYEKEHSNSTLLQLHRQYILTMLEKLGAKMNSETETRVDSLIDFEKKLSKMAIAKIHGTVLLTYKEIKTRFFNIKWDLILNEQIKRALGGVDESTVMQIDTPGYFDKLNQLVVSTPKRVIHDYLLWRLVADYIPYLPENYQEPLNEFNAKSGEKIENISPVEKCVIETIENFEMPLAAEIMYQYFNSSNMEQVKEMIQNIQIALKSEFESADWLDGETREEALKKLDVMGLRLVYPDYIFDREYVGRPYGNVLLSQGHYFDNVINLRKKKQMQNFNLLTRKVGFDWPVRSRMLQMNAGYDPYRNEMVFPLALFHLPLFSSHTPPFVNYGAIGTPFAHEMSHGFDTRGKNFDAQGYERNWWTNETETEFAKRATCFIDQYNQEIEPITETHADGAATQQENIADNGGLKIAYQAYRRVLEQKGDHRALPDFKDFSTDKMFFIVFANNFCLSTKETAIPGLMNVHGHVFDPFRVNVPLRNLPEFSKAFNCQKGKMMYNPENTCRVW